MYIPAEHDLGEKKLYDLSRKFRLYTSKDSEFITLQKDLLRLKYLQNACDNLAKILKNDREEIIWIELVRYLEKIIYKYNSLYLNFKKKKLTAQNYRWELVYLYDHIVIAQSLYNLYRYGMTLEESKYA